MDSATSPAELPPSDAYDCFGWESSGDSCTLWAKHKAVGARIYFTPDGGPLGLKKPECKKLMAWFLKRNARGRLSFLPLSFLMTLQGTFHLKEGCATCALGWSQAKER